MNDYDKLVLPAREIREGDLGPRERVEAASISPGDFDNITGYRRAVSVRLMNAGRVGIRRVDGSLDIVPRTRITTVRRLLS